MQKIPMSPTGPPLPNVFTPFKDVNKRPGEGCCGNPTVYLKDGKMAKWQRKQIEEASLHCRQGQVLFQWKYLYERKMLCKYEKAAFKIKKIRKQEADAQKFVGWARRELGKEQIKSQQLEPMLRKLSDARAEIMALKLAHQKLQEKHLEELKEDADQITQDPAPLLKFQLEEQDQINEKLREELEVRAGIIASLRQLKKERQADGLHDNTGEVHTPPIKIANGEAPAPEKKPTATESMEMMELRKYVKELEDRVAGLSSQAESYQAQIGEADYWVFDRGAIKEELQQLRRTNISNLVEINRLTSESQRRAVELAHAEEGLRMALKNRKQVTPVQ
jgi:hypothetical protein